jgi:hypothetical protein
MEVYAIRGARAGQRQQVTTASGYQIHQHQSSQGAGRLHRAVRRLRDLTRKERRKLIDRCLRCEVS